MSTQITRGVKISVETFYQENYSNPTHGDYMFAYRITIENRNEYTVKLLSRHWYIFDSNNETNEVEGDGVVGKQPVLKPGEIHKYISGCNLKSEIGKMWGTYTMQNMEDGSLFKVDIPEFQLVVPFKMN
ncbi:MAG: Co2+/Mg2+ efflux protein ApaG [Chitinophagales bacterium]